MLNIIKIDHAEKGCIVNIQESLHICLHKTQDKLIDEQKCKDSNCLGLCAVRLKALIHFRKANLCTSLS
jgi:hypothetical protein